MTLTEVKGLHYFYIVLVFRFNKAPITGLSQQALLLLLQLILYHKRYIESKITSSYISENYPKAIEYIDRSGKITLIFLEFVN